MAINAREILCRFVAAFIDFPKPLIGLVNGPAVGISVTTLGLYDYVLAADNVSGQCFVFLGVTFGKLCCFISPGYLPHTVFKFRSNSGRVQHFYFPETYGPIEVERRTHVQS